MGGVRAAAREGLALRLGRQVHPAERTVRPRRFHVHARRGVIAPRRADVAAPQPLARRLFLSHHARSRIRREHLRPPPLELRDRDRRAVDEEARERDLGEWSFVLVTPFLVVRRAQHQHLRRDLHEIVLDCCGHRTRRRTVASREHDPRERSEPTIHT
jgi:hypothetical protein